MLTTQIANFAWLALLLGSAMFLLGSMSKGNAMAAINVRCLEDIDLGSVPVKHFDGRAL